MSRSFTTDMSPPARRGIALVLIVGMVLSVVLAGAVSLFASNSPDGLESVAEQQGFADTGEESAAADSPFADYGVSGLEENRWSVGVAGLAGVAVTAGLAFLVFRSLAARREPDGSDAAPGRAGGG